jgi:hypothetical protein
MYFIVTIYEKYYEFHLFLMATCSLNSRLKFYNQSFQTKLRLQNKNIKLRILISIESMNSL